MVQVQPDTWIEFMIKNWDSPFLALSKIPLSFSNDSTLILKTKKIVDFYQSFNPPMQCLNLS